MQPRRSFSQMPAGSKPRDWLLLWRFGLVGLLNTALGYIFFALFLRAGLGPGACLVAAAVASTAVNFQTARRLVFRSRGRFMRFCAVYCVALTLNWTALHVLRSNGVGTFEAQALLALPIAVLSFFGQQSFVFGLHSLKGNGDA